MYPDVHSALFAVGLFVGMAMLMEAGRRLGVHHIAETKGGRAGMGAVEGAVFALFGLLIAFTFSGAASRFDLRREQIINEASAIETAYLRLDLLPAPAQPLLRDLLRQYADSRLVTYQKLPDIAAAKTQHERSLQLQQQIWTNAVAASVASNYHPAANLLLPAINQMMDAENTRTWVTQMHPPAIIYGLLAALALASALLAGYGMAAGKRRSWLHFIGFPAMISVAAFLTLDIEFPRSGFIRLDLLDQALVNVRRRMD